MGIVRVSRRAGREGDSFVSPTEQRERIGEHCEREGLELVSVAEEIDVQGTTPIQSREGLRAALGAIEEGRAEVLLVAYFDRLFRSIRVQGEVVRRVEAAGGQVLTLDFGEISERTAAQWVTGTMMGVVSEYLARSAKERSGAAQADAIARGVPTWNQITPGYRQGEDRRLYPDPEIAPVVHEAFAMKAEGATIREIRALLAAHGIRRSYHGVQALLGSRVVLGELHFGKLSNVGAHEPIVERELWERVQATRRKRGPAPRSDRLLARLGVLRCASCGSRMVVGTQTQNGRRYHFYRCPVPGDCPASVTIGAEIVEGWVIERVHEALEGVGGRASADEQARAADAKAERSQAALDGAIAALRGLGDEPAAIDKLRELRDARDRDRAEAEHLRGLASALSVDSRRDWHRLTLPERRGLIREVVGTVWVTKGRGTGRLRAEMLVE